MSGADDVTDGDPLAVDAGGVDDDDDPYVSCVVSAAPALLALCHSTPSYDND